MPGLAFSCCAHPSSASTPCQALGVEPLQRILPFFPRPRHRPPHQQPPSAHPGPTSAQTRSPAGSL
eukprot:472939-Alexandrium_andersonii.AAC.1